LKKVLITQSNYIPWKGYFDAIHSVDEVILLDNVQFTRRDWRNRNQIKTPTGIQWITIPVKVKGHFDRQISEIEVSDPGWSARHWKTIYHNYHAAPCFEQASSFVESIYARATGKYLTEINYWFLTELCKWMKISTPIRVHTVPSKEDPTERLVNLCKQTGATHYFTGPSAKSYLKEESFTKENIQIRYLNHENYPPYPQLYPPFAHNVTILDLIFNTGKEYYKYLKTFNS